MPTVWGYPHIEMVSLEKVNRALFSAVVVDCEPLASMKNGTTRVIVVKVHNVYLMA